MILIYSIFHLFFVFVLFLPLIKFPDFNVLNLVYFINKKKTIVLSIQIIVDEKKNDRLIYYFEYIPNAGDYSNTSI